MMQHVGGSFYCDCGVTRLFDCRLSSTQCRAMIRTPQVHVDPDDLGDQIAEQHHLDTSGQGPGRLGGSWKSGLFWSVYFLAILFGALALLYWLGH